MDYFNSRQTDLIIQDGAVFPAVYYNDPTPVHFQGGEAEGKYYLKHDWFFTGSALYQVNDSGAGATNLSPSPSTVVKAGASYQSRRRAPRSAFRRLPGSHCRLRIGAQPAGAGFSIDQRSCALRSFEALDEKRDSRGFALFLNADDLLNKPVWLPALGSGSANTLPVIRGRTVFFRYRGMAEENR